MKKRTTTRTKTRARARTGVAESGGSARRRQRTARAAIAVVVAMVITVVDVGVAWAANGGIGEVKSFAGRLTTYVTAVAASVAVLFIAVNGIRWTMSSGNPGRQAEARAGLLAAVAGLAIALSAGLIVHLVVAALR